MGHSDESILSILFSCMLCGFIIAFYVFVKLGVIGNNTQNLSDVLHSDMVYTIEDIDNLQLAGDNYYVESDSDENQRK